MTDEITSSLPAEATTATTLAPEPQVDIGDAVVIGVKWKVFTQVVSEASRVAVTLVQTRLLTPSDYGVAGMAIVCASFAGMLMDPALGLALIQRPRITEADRSTVFWATVGIGATATVAGVAASGLVADLFGEPEVRNLFIVLSLGFVISSLSMTQTSLLARDLAYRNLEVREIFATVLAAIAAIAVAFAGWGPWAIIANWMVFVVATTIMVWTLSPWRPKMMFSLDSLRNLGGFGIKVFGARVLGWMNGNMDNVLVGRFLGAAPLGAYSIAYNVMYVPMTRIAVPLAHVLSPAYARMQDDHERLERAWLRSKRVSVALLAPGFLACLVLAPDLVPVAFGPNWEEAVVPLQLLCLAGVAVSLVTLGFGMLMAKNKAGTLLRVNILTSIVTVGAFAAGVQYGIVGVAGFYAAARWILSVIETKITTRAVGFDFWQTMLAGTSMLPLAVGAAAATFGARQLMLVEDVPGIVRLVVGSAVFLAVYVTLLRIAVPSLLAEVTAFLRRRRLESSRREEIAAAS